MEVDLKMDILKGKRYDVMNVLWEEGKPLSAFEINEIAPELKMPTVRRCLELLYERETDRGSRDFHEWKGLCEKLQTASFQGDISEE